MQNTFDRIVKDIKSLKIQGAENVALKSLQALDCILVRSKAKNAKQLSAELAAAKNMLFSTRPTEPAMRNALDYAMLDAEKSDIDILRKEVGERIDYGADHLKESKDIILKLGSKKIENKMKIFTHCHSSTVTGIFRKAKESGISFEVHNTETRPLFQGRKTAAELAALKIPVKHYVDSAARLAVKNCDLAMFGADAITPSRIYNKIGTELFAEICYRYQIPTYICTDSWKFDAKSIYDDEEKIEERPPDEIWPKAPKGVEIKNYAFEKIDPELVAGIISELGIFQHNMFISEVMKKYPWMFRK